MIVYLGMPRCASSWLYDHLEHLEFGDTTKETHYLYSQPNDVDNYSKSRFLDFSTNNWSMDSDVAKQLDPFVKSYLYIVRDPVELAASYQGLIQNNQTLDEFVTSMIFTRLLCFGDIIERWYNLVDPNKIHIYTYKQLQMDPEYFLKKLANDIGVNLKSIDVSPTNVATNKKYENVSQENINILNKQLDKFSTITGINV